MFVFRTAKPIAAFKLGDDISGRTAGSGKAGAGAGEAERRTAGEDPKDDRRLEAVAGGSMGRGVVIGVPGFEGAGEAIVRPAALVVDARWPVSTGAGLCVDTVRPGRSILLNLPWVDKVQEPSLSLNAYMWTVLSDD